MSIEILKEQMRACNIFTMRTDIQAEVATRLFAGGITPADIGSLVRAAEATHKTRGAAIATVCRVLRLSIEHIKEAVRNARQDEARESEHNDKAVAKTTASAPRFASPGNPYGWSNPDTIRGQDHGENGAWNPYRQCYNMTHAEMRRENVHDPRRNGCSRFEVLGKVGRVKPKARWDQAEAARLQHMSTLSEPIGGGTEDQAQDQDQDRVYGE